MLRATTAEQPNRVINENEHAAVLHDIYNNK